jgi:multicomponent Na+:H+ antiporter subunit A
MILVILSSFVIAFAAPRLVRMTGDKSGYILALLPAAHFIYLLTYAGEVSGGTAVAQQIDWVPYLAISFSFWGDGLSLSFGLLISGIGALVIIYAGAYMKGERYLPRMYLYLFLFMGSMQGIVFADNIVTLFIFWELTSITSYLIIGYDHKDESARSAALQALLVTGGGGLALMAGLILLGAAAESYELSEIIQRGDLIREHPYYLAIVVLVLLGCFTKSAQFPFHFWLPNAMAAPTPASAYLHSSTMVKAGLYLMARLSPALGETLIWQYALVGAGAATMLVAGYLALQQSTLKPLLAYTTVSALGIITFCIGMGTPAAMKAAMVFLFVHALYKAALFMVAGGIDHEAGEKDTERLGGLAKAMPVTAGAAILAGLSMAGIPPLLGFMGKELIYEAAIHGTLAVSMAWVAVLVAANAVNTYAALAVVYKPFWGARVQSPKTPHDGPGGLWLGPLILGIFALIFGLAPQLLGQSLADPAATAMLGRPVEAAWYLWHGFNLALLLSAVTLAFGAALYLFRKPLRRAGAILQPAAAAGPEAGFNAALSAMLATARFQTRILQNGYLRLYLMVVFVFILAFPGRELLTKGAMAWPTTVLWPQIYEFALALLIVVSTIVVITAQSRLAAVAALGALGYSVAVIFVLFGAPDLAMTQFIIETLLVIILLLVLHHLPKFRDYSGPVARGRDIVISVLSGVFMTMLVIAALEEQGHDPVSHYYSGNAVVEAHGRNVVNVILVDFRALDTLGEITVLAIAALGAVSLLKLQTSEGDAP